MSLAIARWMTLAWLFCTAGNALAQSEWDVMGIYIPDSPEVQSRIIPRQYTPIKIRDLEDRLIEIETLRREQQFLSQGLQDAFYVARLEEGNLVSESSRWRLAGNLGDTLAVGKFGCVLTDARNATEKTQQLSSMASYDVSGQMMLPGSGSLAEYWFGFVCHGTASMGKSLFEFKLPVANISQMVLVTPSNIELVSDEVPVISISTINDILPKDWPSDLRPTVFPNERIWLVSHSGLSDFSLAVIEPDSDAQAPKISNLIRSCSIEYLVSSGGISVEAEFDLANEPSNPIPSVFLDPRLKISSVLVDGVTAQWSVMPESDGKRMLAISSGMASETEETRVQVLGFIPLEIQTQELRRTLPMPIMEVANAHMLAGTTTVRSAEPYCIAAIDSNDGVFNLLTEDVEGVDPFRISRLKWSSRWIGQPPLVGIRIAKRESPWRVDSITKLSAQDSWVSARSRIRLQSESVLTNELQIRIAEGWFVDNLRLVGDNASQVRAQLVESGESEDRISILALSWEVPVDEAEIELEFDAHVPINDVTEVGLFHDSRLIQLEGSVHVDCLVFEPSNKFQLDFNSQLVSKLASPLDLEPWQQSFIQELQRPITIRSASETFPTVHLKSAQGSYNANLNTKIERTDATLSAETLLTITPLGQQMEQLSIAIPEGFFVEDFSFELIDRASLSPIEVQADKLQSGNVFVIAMPTPTSDEVQLKINHVAGLERPVPIVGVPVADQVQSVVRLGPSLKLGSVLPGLEFLPPAHMRSPTSGQTPDEDLRIIEFRMDGSQPNLLEVVPQTNEKASGWILSEDVLHRITNSETIEHLIRLELETASAKKFRFLLPMDCEVEHVVLNGETKSINSRSPVTGALQNYVSYDIDVEPYEHQSIEIVYGSRPNGWWMAGQPLQRPQYEMPVLSFREHVRTAPAMKLLFAEEAAKRSLTSRFLPSQWWSVVSPRQASHSTVGWHEIVVDTQVAKDGAAPAKNAWFLSRSTLASMNLAFLLCGCALTWIGLGRRLLYWWIAICLSLVALTLVPNSLVPAIQLVVLSLAVALALRILETLFTIQKSWTTVARSPVHKSVVSSTLLFFCLWCSEADGQNVASVNAPAVQSPTIYGVLIPVDEERNISGDVAYIPNRLFNILSGANGQQSPMAPRIVSSDYLLRTRSSSSTDRETVHEFIVDLVVQVDTLDLSLTVPISRRQLNLISVQVRGQERLPGLSVRQSEDSVVYRPNETGLVPIRLVFNVVRGDATDQAVEHSLDTRIPAIPNAKLRLVGEDFANVLVNGRNGAELRSNSNEMLFYLGPTSQLQVEWSAQTRRPSSLMPSTVSSEAWLHCTNKQIQAACRLQLTKEAWMPNQLRINIDEGWEPIGKDWGDVQLERVETSLFGKRRSYVVSLPRSADPSESTFAIQVNLTPSSAATSVLNVPFLSVQEIVLRSVSRSVAWSIDGSADWKVDGMDFWPQLSTSTVNWTGAKFASQKRIYRVPLSATSPQVRRLVDITDTSVDEVLDFHLRSDDTLISYRSTLPASFESQGHLTLELPRACLVDRIELNGQSQNFETVVADDVSYALVPIASGSATRSTEVACFATVATVLSEDWQLPRPIIRSLRSRSLRMSFYRDSSVNVEIQEPEKDKFSLQFATNAATERLDNFEILFAKADQLDNQEQHGRLPFTCLVQKRNSPSCDTLTKTLFEQDGNWRIEVVAKWFSSDADTDFAFFDVPASLRDSVDTGSQPRKFLPTNDSSRSLLCLVPTLMPDGKIIASFSFPVSTSPGSQAIPSPAISWVGPRPTQSRVALPKKVGGTRVQWVDIGNPIVGDDQAEKEFRLYEPESNARKYVWALDEPTQKSATVKNRSAEVLSIARGSLLLAVDYWIVPNGDSVVDVALPEETEIVGVQCGGEVAHWSVSDRGIAILMQPSYSPLNLRLLLRRTIENAQRIAFEFPSLSGIEIEDPNAVILLQSDFNYQLKEGMPDSESETRMAGKWWQLIRELMTNLPESDDSAVAACLRSWSPTEVGVATAIPVSVTASEGADLGLSDSEDRTVGEIWKALCKRYPGLDSFQSIPPAVSRNAFVVTQNLVELERAPRQSIGDLGPRVWAGILLAFACTAFFAMTRRFWSLYLTSIVTNPWLLWLQMTLLAWWLLPVAWPSLILGIATLWQASSQLWERSRRWSSVA